MCLVALVSLAAHLLAAGRYGFHRDELYYIACGMHPAWGYVDHPALTPMLARLAVALFGGSLVGLRLFAALAAAAVIVLTGAIARAMGGGPFAAALAAVAVGFPAERLAPYFAVVTPAATITNALDAPNQERGRPVLICRLPRVPLAQVWPDFKHYI